MSERDPVFEWEDGQWFFWDETWSQSYGPYETEWKAREALHRYCVAELGAPA